MQIKSNNKRRAKWLALFLGFVIVLGLAFFPTKYYVEVPGGADKLSEFVHVAGKKDTAKGSYRLMTVGVIGPASPAILLWGKFQPFAQIVSRADLMGDASATEYNELQNYYIQSAANDAIYAAMHAAKQPVTLKYEGIYVMSVLKQSNFARDLRVGDVITAINGKRYDSASGFQAAIKRHRVNSKLTITYVRNGKTHHATRKLVHLPHLTGGSIGIQLTDKTSVQSKIKVKIDAGKIGGPSAGLMFALQVYDEVTGGHLRAGRTIAGTGTIDSHGNVGVIGGIDKKVYAAAKAGATIFFAPDVPATKAIKAADPTYVNNYVEAKRAAKKMKTKMVIVPVKTMQDAVEYMQSQ